jgi:hypothetical protein
MRDLLWKESSKITDFAMRKGLNFKPYDISAFGTWKGFDHSAAFSIDFDRINIDKHKDVYIASCEIPKRSNNVVPIVPF